MRANSDARKGPPGGDTRGKFEAWSVIALVVALLIGSVMAAFMLPIGVDAIVDDKSKTFTQNESETVVVTGSLNATLTDVDDTSDDITVDLNDSDADSATLSGISVGDNATATVNGETITVTNEENVDTSTAKVTYEYPSDYNWGSGAKALWGILDVILVLAMFLMFVGVALGAANRV